jgi:hypothetical protein
MSDKTGVPPSAENRSSNAVDKVIAALLREGTPQEIIQTRLTPDVIGAVAGACSQTDTISDHILDRLCPTDLPRNEAFYARLAQLEFKLGWSNEARQLAGILWARVFARLGEVDKRSLLFAMIEPGTHFFTALQALQPLFNNMRLTAICWSSGYSRSGKS